MTTAFKHRQPASQSHSVGGTLRFVIWLTLAIAAVTLASCKERAYTQNIPFNPVKTLTDHGFSVQADPQRETRNQDGSTEFSWHGTITSATANDWEVIPDLWCDDIAKNLTAKPDKQFSTSRQPGEPFEGGLVWMDNDISAEMKITLKPGQSVKTVNYDISLKEHWVK